MGGFGSGNHDWRRRKATVDESLSFAVQDIQRWQSPAGTGTMTWTGRSGWQSSVCFRATWLGEAPAVSLSYTINNTQVVRLVIPLQRTPTPFDGRRWWFTCPLIVGGVACRRRVGKLHLPPGAKLFGCRHCYGLTYRSSQQAHQDDRLANRLPAHLGIRQKLDRLLLKNSRKRI